MTAPSDFEAALAAVAAQREAVKNLPPHVLDQLGAAEREAHEHALRLRDALAELDPDRRWSSFFGRHQVPDEVGAVVLLAMAGLRACPHLRRVGPRPAYARLALHRLDCRRCLGTVRKPPAGEDDRCDWCGSNGNIYFRAFALQLGTVVVIGDAGRCCAGTLTWFEREEVR